MKPSSGQESLFHEPEKRVRAAVIGPYREGDSRSKTEPVTFGTARPEGRCAGARLAEALGLAQAIGLDVIESQIAGVRQVRPGSFLGKGKMDELAAVVAAQRIELVIMDCALSPVQQRNLEQALAAKVIDRTGLILEIFGRRARTREGALQVELAHLAYQKSRLVRSWTHLERQRGGFGFLGGPGETQIEADRRLIEERMTRIDEELENVRRTRGLHRKSRRAVPYPAVVMVGYTNAGKSTLFNRLTQAGVAAGDQLFATLDPTSRAIKLPHGGQIILSDTVGFISGLPTMLIKAFRATLEEIEEADLILHIRDVSHPDAEAQRADVETVLASLSIDLTAGRRLLEVWNKSDLIEGAGTRPSLGWAAAGKPVIISALTGQGIDELSAAIEERLAGERPVFDLAIDPANGHEANWLHKHTEILHKDEGADGIMHYRVRVAPEWAGRLRRKFAGAGNEQPLAGQNMRQRA